MIHQRIAVLAILLKLGEEGRKCISMISLSLSVEYRPGSLIRTELFFARVLPQ
jgi:hypothetical protein